MAIFNEYPYINFTDLNLDAIIKKIYDLLNRTGNLEAWATEHSHEFEELKEFMQRLREGELTPPIIEGLNAWMREYGIDLVGNLAKMVFFGLTDSGYFTAFIPESWDEIEFDTTDEGNLTLSY